MTIEKIERRLDDAIKNGTEADVNYWRGYRDAVKAMLKEEPNEPLTLEGLRGMDGVVWICYPQATFGTRLPPADQLTCTRYKFPFSEYGETWLAFRRLPKEGNR